MKNKGKTKRLMWMTTAACAMMFLGMGVCLICGLRAARESIEESCKRDMEVVMEQLEKPYATRLNTSDELTETMNPALSPIEKLILMNQELFLMIDNTVSVDLLSQLFATQLITSGEKHMMSPNRTYYKLLRQVISEGKQSGVFQEAFSVNDIAKAYAMFERGLMYDWCISSGSYSLCQYSQSVLPLFLKSFCT